MIVFIILYLISFPLTIYLNSCRMMGPAERPLITRYSSFTAIILSIAYGSIIGIWIFLNWKYALTLFITYKFVDIISYRLYLKRYIYKTALRLSMSDWFEKELPEDLRTIKAYEWAANYAKKNENGENTM